MTDMGEAPDVAGRRLDGAGFTIGAEVDAALRRSLGDTAALDGAAHAVWVYIATQRGMGLSVAELCAACDFDVADGPMLASSQLTLPGVLRVDTFYEVQGEIQSLVRKDSKKLGAMDLLTYELRLIEPGSAPVAVARNVWVLPRGRAT